MLLDLASQIYIILIQGWITSRARETVALGRELLGGNGISTDFHVAKVITIFFT